MFLSKEFVRLREYHGYQLFNRGLFILVLYVLNIFNYKIVEVLSFGVRPRFLFIIK
jgi:hypothetical protein